MAVHQKESSLSRSKLNRGILRISEGECTCGYVCVCLSQGSGDRGEAQVFVYTHTTISGHSRVPLLGQAERSEQATGLCVQKLLTVLTLVQVSCRRCTNTAKQAADRYSRRESPQGRRHKTKPVAFIELLTQCRKRCKSRVKVAGFPLCCCLCLWFIHSFLLLYLLLTTWSQ